MEKMQWFKFSPADWLMGKIQRVPDTTQVRFIRLICLYWNKGCKLSIEDAEIEVDKEHLDILLSKKIVKNSEGMLCIDFLNEQLVSVENISEQRKEAAKARWSKKNNSSTSAMQMHEVAMQNDADKIREDNINSALTVNWDGLKEQFSEITGKRCLVVNDKVKRSILARLKEGYSKEDIATAIYNCYNDPYHKETGHKYLTLEFISRPDKLEKYSTITHVKPKIKEEKL